MKTSILTYGLITIAVVGSLSSCLMRQTVTENGEQISSNYVVKRPLKDVVGNSGNSN